LEKLGRFIVVEGGDGAGKGSVITDLAHRLRACTHDVVVTREPGGTSEGAALRALLLADAGTVWDPRAELLLMIAARIQHVARLIQPAVQSGQIVLCDRFFASTLAYQGAGRGIPTDLITQLHHTMVGGLEPDLTLLLDVDPAIALRRSRARLLRDPSVDEGRFESLDLSFHTRVRASYLDQARGNPAWHIIDASRPLQQVQDDAAASVMAS
jgi:dTMP kinase